MTTTPREARPAFYALASGGWRDLVTLLHPPYTAWHVSYVALGAATASTLHLDRLGAVLGAFFLAVGVSAHALDELQGRPLRTQLGDRVLIGLAAGGLLVPAYNLELAGGRFHSDLWFALAWGAFPAFTGYFAQSLQVRPQGVLIAAACFCLSLAQRRLSTPARTLRRRTVSVSGQQRLRDGSVLELDQPALAAPLEGALSVLWLAVVLLAVGAVVARL